VRIDDPNAKFIVITKPDAGKIFLMDTGAKTEGGIDRNGCRCRSGRCTRRLRSVSPPASNRALV